MIIRLTPPQIAEHWSTVKHALINGDFILPDQRQKALNQILQELLCGKAQCFFRLDPKTREVLTVIVTKLLFSERSEEKFLYNHCVFAFKRASPEEWQIIWDFLTAFAKAEDCKFYQLDTGNPKMQQIMKGLNVRESYVTYIVDIN